MSQVKLNLGANFVGKGWSALMGLVFIPLFIQLMGVEAYGLVGVFTTLQAVFVLMDLGLTTTLNREIARYSASDKLQDMRESLVKEFLFKSWDFGGSMKTVILAGGFGTRLAEETEVRPKPMVEIGERPILWHMMKYYASFGFNEFVIALGYKGELIKRFFIEQATLQGDLSIEMQAGIVTARHQLREDWVVHLVDTGLDSSTGGRIARVREYLDNETFMLTYGDGLANVDINALLALHYKCGRTVTLTAVRPPARFGGLIMDGNAVIQFTEKPQIGEGWINGGFMVMEPKVLDYITSDQTNLEVHVLEQLAQENELAAYQHDDFWQCMDTLRDKRQLENLWRNGSAPWKSWI